MRNSHGSQIVQPLRDCYIGVTVRSILDIMEFTDKENIPGILIFIDFKNAFDTLEWPRLNCFGQAFLSQYSKLCNK